MPLYESVVIARQDIATTQVDTLADELTNIITEGGGKITKRELWGLRSLTYRIKKNRKAPRNGPAPVVKGRRGKEKH